MGFEMDFDLFVFLFDVFDVFDEFDGFDFSSLFGVGTELATIANDPYYDFNYQQSHTLDPEITLLPGDELIVTCTYENPFNQRMFILSLMRSLKNNDLQ